MSGGEILETNISSPIGSIFVQHNCGPWNRVVEATEGGIRKISASLLESKDGTTQVIDRWNFSHYPYDFPTFVDEICLGGYFK